MSETVKTTIPIAVEKEFDFRNNPSLKTGIHVYTNTGKVTTNTSENLADKYIVVDASGIKSVEFKGRVASTDYGTKGIIYTDSDGAIISKDFGGAIEQTDGKTFCSDVPNEATKIHFAIYDSDTVFTVIKINKFSEVEVDDTNFNHIYYCGSSRKYKTLRSVIEEAEKHMDSVVYVDAETFNLVEEFGQEYLDSYDGSDGMIGLLLKNRIKLIFASGSKVIFNYTGAN